MKHNKIGNALLALLAIASMTHAQDPPSPAADTSSTAIPSPAARNVRISFLPPPIKGSISLGIYDGSGKLVRVLHREADLEEFQIGPDALSTTWDGIGDDQQPLPAGKYHARGYVVGDVGVEGIGFYFNDWISDEHPERIEKICTIAAEDDRLVVTGRIADGTGVTLLCDAAGAVVETRGGGDCAESESSMQGDSPGKDDTRWKVESAPDDAARKEVNQYSATNELLRSLKVPADDPQPRAVAASAGSERIYLLEENATVQRVRALSLVGTTADGEQAKSDWKVDFEKSITAHKDFEIENGEPVVNRGIAAPPGTVTIKLQPNALEKNKATKVDVAVGYDAEGSFLKTADGLPLQTISETQRLSRAVTTPRDAKSVDVFQDDGAVVEQFRLTRLGAMMAFDCGDFELK